ncbi:MAG: ATP-binding cassette domain-containing protein [Deinococcus sp.]|nr:ATP-binding cassette domain-containing protein [Deinococcus sp.]
MGDDELVAVLGPSGCGKSTLLRLIAGLERPTSGQVQIDGRPARPGLAAMAFQDPGLLPWLTARQNVALAGPDPDSYLKAVGLEGAGRLFPWELSGGMRQRIGLARALASQAPVILLDEPFAAVDALTRRTLWELLARLRQERRGSYLLVTHNVEEALALADRILILMGPPGRICRELVVDGNRSTLASVIYQELGVAEGKESDHEPAVPPSGQLGAVGGVSRSH